jgi:hypothetical protein
MSENLSTVQASINVLTIDGLTVTKDIAKQLDELRFEQRDRFEAHGRVRTGRDYGDPGIELLGRDRNTGALVRMWHITKPMWVRHFDLQANRGAGEYLPAIGDGLQDIRDALTETYNRLPLIVLPKDARL